MGCPQLCVRIFLCLVIIKMDQIQWVDVLLGAEGTLSAVAVCLESLWLRETPVTGGDGSGTGLRRCFQIPHTITLLYLICLDNR